MAHPTDKQVAAVRAVIYKGQRARRIKADYHSILVLMNLDNPSQPETAPDWIVSDTGQPGFSITESVKRCRSIAGALRASAADLADLDIPAADRGNLRTVLVENANAWDARAAVWAAPRRPDLEAAVARISGPQLRAFRAARKVKDYLKSIEEVADLLGAL